MFSVGTKLRESTLTRPWVLLAEWTTKWPSGGLSSVWKNVAGPRLLEWSILLLGCMGVVLYWQRWKRWSLSLLVFQRDAVNIYIYIFFFSEIFKGRQIILDPCRNLKCPIRSLSWWHKTLPGVIRKTSQV